MPPGSSQLFERRRTLYVCFFFALVTTLLYWRTIGYEFIVVDDHKYVYQNNEVVKGLTWEGIKWAFTTVYASNWHPLTWISHMLDCSLFHLFAGAHHLTSVGFHIANTILLFLALRNLTKKFWPSAFVAALFAWHPMHVESVAWICERKDVLSTFFLTLTLWTYSRYVAQRSAGKYFLTLALFACGLMSKPMLVTLPCVLLLLDFWPLTRFRSLSISENATPQNTQHETRDTLRSLLLEKIPFFVLSILSCVITVIAQHKGGAIQTFENVSLSSRVINAVNSYGVYLAKALCPIHLSVFYPLPTSPSWILFAISVVILPVLTAIAVRSWRTSPWLLVGWFWFLGTLVPVIGLVQVGNQAIADRYTYIPYIGLFIMLAWSMDAFYQRFASSKFLLIAAASIALLACLILTSIELSYWRNSIRLFTRAIAVTQSNVFCERNLSYALSEAGRGREAIPHYQALLKLAPEDAKARYNLGLELISAGQPADAEQQFSEALKQQPQSDKLHNSLGIALSQQGKLDRAGAEFEKAIALNPQFPWPHLNYAVVLQGKGIAGAAITNYTTALQLQPGWPEALDKLAFLLATCPDSQWRDPAKAIKFSNHANDLTERKSPDLLETLAIAYAAAGDFSNAVTTATLAQKQAQSAGLQPLAAKLEQDIENYRAQKIPPLDWKTPPASIILRR